MSDLNEQVKLILSKTEDNFLISIGLKILPYGEIAETVLFDKIRRERQKRLEFLAEELKKRVSNIEDTSLTREYLESEDLVLLIEKIIQAVIKEQEKEKIANFASVLINSISRRVKGSSKRDYYLQCLAELLITHIAILSMCYARNRVMPLTIDFPSLLDCVPDRDEDLCVALCEELRQKGLCHIEYGPKQRPLSIRASNLGIDFLDFIISEERSQ